jgi:hypothetical protein
MSQLLVGWRTAALAEAAAVDEIRAKAAEAIRKCIALSYASPS